MSTVLPPPDRATSAAVDNPYAAPQSRVDDAPTEGSLMLASRGTRFLAALVDSLLVAGPFLLLSFMMPAMVDGPNAAQFDSFQFGLLAIVAASILLVVTVVNCVLLHRNGQTIAKRMFGIKVVRADGSRCALSRIIFARWLPLAVVGAIPLVGPIASLIDSLMIFRENHRCLHDEIADTIVVIA